MADISITYQHRLGRTLARQRAAEVLKRLANKHRIVGTWTGDTFVVTSPAKGTFVVGDAAVVVTLTLGVLTIAIKPQIEAAVREELSKALDA